MKNSTIYKYLDQYFEINEPGFGVLIDGPWGSGKTYIINEIRGRFKKKFTIVYVTLNGLTNVTGIDDQIFSELHPIISSKAAKLLRTGIKILAKASLKLDLDDKHDTATLQIPDVKLSDFIKVDDGKKYILIFDDLERCEVPIETVLGYINNFIEHQGLHVLIAGNITKSKDGNKLAEILEKTIGRIFTVEPDFDSAFEHFLTGYAETVYGQIFMNQKRSFLSVFSNANERNLRILKYSMDECRSFLSLLPQKALDIPEFVSETLEAVSALAIQIRTRSVDLRNHTETNPYDTYTHELVRQFTTNKSYDRVPSGDVLTQYFLNGYVDNKAMNDCVNNSRFFIDSNTPAWRRLYMATVNDTQAFDSALSETVTAYQNNEYRDQRILLHVAGMFYFFKSENIGVDSGYVKLLEEKIDQMIKSGELEAESSNWFNDSERREFGYSMRYYSYNTVAFKKLLGKIEKYNRLYQEGELNDFAVNLPHNIRTNLAGIVPILTTSGPSEIKYTELPVLSFANAAEVSNAILTLNGTEIARFGNILKNRYTHALVSLKDEINFLRSLQKNLSNKSKKSHQLTAYNIRKHILPPLKDAIRMLEIKSPLVSIRNPHKNSKSKSVPQ